MLIDEVKITLKGGHGGAGKVSFYPPPMRGPDGGNGGKGGDVYIKGTTDLTALNQFSAKKSFSAENGEPGERNRKQGKVGQDLTITVPVGSELINQDTGEILEITTPEKPILVCKGGLGGRGNFEFKSPRRTTPEFAQPGLEGEEIHFDVVLRLIADYGIIGLPNAGKSSLLNELTSAKVKVANYPFTTLEPNLGVIDKKVMADIPGLIEGASQGKGLGIKFLKHIEKVSMLIHCISSESEDPIRDYQIVRDELKSFNAELLDKPEVILVTKADLIDKSELKKIITRFKKLKKDVYSVSIHDWDSLEKLKENLRLT